MKGLKCLRSLDLHVIRGLDRVDGLQDLNRLVYFKWVSSKGYVGEEAVPRRVMEQLPASLKVIELAAPRLELFLFKSDLFARCTNLTTLKLRYNGCVKNMDFMSDCASLQTMHIFLSYEAENLYFSTECSSLQTVKLSGLYRLKCVAGLSPEATSNLQFLEVNDCSDLVEILGLDQMVGLQHLYLYNNYRLKKLPNLQKLTRLQVLDISLIYIEEVPSLSWLRQLRELRWTNYSSTSMKLPSLSRFEQLETVNLRGNSGLSSLEGVFGDLPAFQRLNLSGCRSLSRLPNLSRTRNLEKLDLSDSGVELREEDMCMLAALPLLHAVLVGTCDNFLSAFRLDVVRRKVDKADCGSGKWEKRREWGERDLGMLPIRADSIGEGRLSEKIGLRSALACQTREALTSCVEARRLFSSLSREMLTFSRLNEHNEDWLLQLVILTEFWSDKRYGFFRLKWLAPRNGPRGRLPLLRPHVLGVSLFVYHK